MTVNKVILVGNLGRDPELRTANSGTTIASLNLATSERRKDRDGNWSDHTEWHRCTLFGKNAASAQRYLRKGSQVYLEGRLSTRKWEDKSGQTRWTTEVVVDNMRFLGKREDNGGQREEYGKGQYRGSQRTDRKPAKQSSGYTPPDYGSQGGGDDDDIPF